MFTSSYFSQRESCNTQSNKNFYSHILSSKHFLLQKHKAIGLKKMPSFLLTLVQSAVINWAEKTDWRNLLLGWFLWPLATPLYLSWQCWTEVSAISANTTWPTELLFNHFWMSPPFPQHISRTVQSSIPRPFCRSIMSPNEYQTRAI